MYLPFFHPIADSHEPDEQPSVVSHERQSISVEGSEFLDDALYTEGLIIRTEVCVATGAPDNLL